eukprot:SAG31_NODE_2248_length_6093_cov_4.382716_6_plen_486_part_00
MTVGGGSHYLLNIPPNSSGLIPEAYHTIAKEFGEGLRSSIGSPVAQLSNRSGPCHEPIILSIPSSAKAVDMIQIREDVRHGQKIAKYALDALTPNGTWSQLEVRLRPTEPNAATEDVEGVSHGEVGRPCPPACPAIQETVGHRVVDILKEPLGKEVKAVRFRCIAVNSTGDDTIYIASFLATAAPAFARVLSDKKSFTEHHRIHSSDAPAAPLFRSALKADDRIGVRCAPKRWFAISWAATHGDQRYNATNCTTCEAVVPVHRFQVGNWTMEASLAVAATLQQPAGQHALLDWGVSRSIQTHPDDNLLTPAESVLCRNTNFSGLWWDAGARLVAEQYLDFFTQFQAQAGHIDELVLDPELWMYTWVISTNAPWNGLPDCVTARYRSIQRDTRFASVQAELLRRGFVPVGGLASPNWLHASLVLDIDNETLTRNMNIFNALVLEITCSYFNNATFKPLRSLYPQVRSYFLVSVPTIRETRDFYRAM